MKRNDRIAVKKLTIDNLTEYNELLRYAFQVTEKTLVDIGWEDEGIRKSKYPVLERADVLGCYDADRLASQLAVYPLQMNLHNRIIDIGFVTSVSTYPEYSGMGLVSGLIKQGLTDMQKKGQSLSLLYPYSIPFYRHKGWEIISDKMSFRIKDTQLPQNIKVPGVVRRVTDNAPDLLSLHNRFARQRHGCIIRDGLAWEEYWRWDVEDTQTAIYYNAQDLPCGYMVYLLRDDIMYIKEMIHLNMEAWRGLWKFIGAHESMVNEVQGNHYFSDPISFWLEDSDIKETIRPYIMGRIVDVEQFIRQYAFLQPERLCSVVFRVEDSVLEWNNDIYRLTVGTENQVNIRKTGETPDFTVDIGTLTAMLLGYKRPGELAKMERVKMPAHIISILESVIPDQKPYISDYI